jgi:hypothetical protein
LRLIVIGRGKSGKVEQETGWSETMSILRYIDPEGREQDVDDVNHLYELIQGKHVGYDSLVWDDEDQRWVAARDHYFFRRIREIAAASPAPQQPWSAPSQHPARTVAIQPQVYKSPRMQNRNPIPDEAESGSQKSKSNWFKTIQTREEALKTISVTALGFFAIAGIQTLAGLFLIANSSDVGLDMLIDVPLYVGLAAWLKWGRSRTAAVLLLIVASISAVTTVLGQLRIIDGGRNMFLAAIVFWTAVKAVEATFKLRGRFKHEETVAEPQLG